MIYDVIGDIHGRADKLIGLLETLGYRATHFTGDVELGTTYYQPPAGHRALFIGDLIDRGAQERQTLQIVYAMIDAGVADAIMGNHEYNALAYATRSQPLRSENLEKDILEKEVVEKQPLDTIVADNPSNPDAPNEQKPSYLRSHNSAHTQQHQAFLDEIPFGSSEHQYWLKRFYELPLWLETEQACFVHACWDVDKMAILRPLLTSDNRLTALALQKTARENSAEFDALERVLKGVEVALPDGISFTDKEGTVRRRMRVRWWQTGADKPALNGQPIINIARAPKTELAQIPQDAIAQNVDFYLQTHKPIFIGHYWLTGTPAPLSAQVVCIDYSAAGSGYLTAYQFDSHHPLPLSADNFVQFKHDARVK